MTATCVSWNDVTALNAYAFCDAHSLFCSYRRQSWHQVASVGTSYVCVDGSRVFHRSHCRCWRIVNLMTEIYFCLSSCTLVELWRLCRSLVLGHHLQFWECKQIFFKKNSLYRRNPKNICAHNKAVVIIVFNKTVINIFK